MLSCCWPAHPPRPHQLPSTPPHGQAASPSSQPASLTCKLMGPHYITINSSASAAAPTPIHACTGEQCHSIFNICVWFECRRSSRWSGREYFLVRYFLAVNGDCSCCIVPGGLCRAPRTSAATLHSAPRLPASGPGLGHQCSANNALLPRHAGAWPNLHRQPRQTQNFPF